MYFILVFACFYQQQQQVQTSSESSPCLENNVNNLNDVFGLLGELNKATSFSSYVSNISYEAYSNSNSNSGAKQDLTIDQSAHNKTNDYLIYVTLVLILVLLVGFLFNVLVRQQKLIKAPVWFPPIGDDSQSKPTYLSAINSNKLKNVSESSYEMAMKQIDELGYTNQAYTGNYLTVISDQSSDGFSYYSHLNNVQKQNYTNQ